MAQTPQMRWRTVIAALLLILTGCGTAKAPPGWPAGEARPINATTASKAAR